MSSSGPAAASVQWLLERLGTGDPEALAAQLMILAEGASATETLLAAAGVFAQAAK